MSGVGICIVGHVRTFYFPNIQRGFSEVLLKSFPQARVHGILFTAKHNPPIARYDVPQSSDTLHSASVDFDQLHQFRKSDCGTYKIFTAARSCSEDVAWLQIAWVKECFKTLPSTTSVYVRARPDSFFAYVPPLQVRANSIVTWEKHDAPVSDQFFVMGRDAYAKWFANFAPHGCCAEYDVDWRRQGALQNTEILACIARSENVVKCWKSNKTQVRLIETALLSTTNASPPPPATTSLSSRLKSFWW